MGMRDDSVKDQALSMFQDTVVVTLLRSLGLQLLTGLVVGAFAGLWLCLVTRVLGRRLGRLGFVCWLCAFLGAVHLFALWHAMALVPQPFVDSFHQAGAVASWFQRAGSEWFPVWLAPALFWVLVWSVPAMLIGVGLKRSDGRNAVLATAAGMTVLALVFSVVSWLPSRDSRRFPTSSAGDSWNVLILAGDSLRPDALEQSSEGGYARMTRDGISFQRAYTLLPRTFPAWLTLLTGQHPHTHGIRDMFPSPSTLSRPFAALPRELGSRGYRTGVFSDFAGDIFGRADLGFDHVEVPEFTVNSNVRLGVWKMQVHLFPYLLATGLTRRIPEFYAYERLPDAAGVTERFFRWVRSADSTAPFLGVLFYSTPHFPYSAPYPYYRKRSVPGYDGAFRYCKTGLSAGALGAEDIQQVRALFQAGTDTVDHEIARVLTWLEETGQLDRTIVVVLSDHGENLYEHGRGNTHGDLLVGRESLQIPYVFRVPGRQPGIVRQVVSSATLAPTILGLLGGPVPDWMEGMNLAQFPGMTPPDHETVHGETGLLFVDPDTDFLVGRSIRYAGIMGRFDVDPVTSELYLNPAFRGDSVVAKHRMILKWPLKLVYVPTRYGVEFECYQVEDDPDELINLWTSAPNPCTNLVDELHQYARSGGERVEDGYILP
jgi:arylsulfatase A-like enzyme